MSVYSVVYLAQIFSLKIPIDKSIFPKLIQYGLYRKCPERAE